MAQEKSVVYVVDDENLIAETLAMILNQAGFAATAFFNPKHALSAADSGTPPNLLISDVLMPEMSGIELGIEFHRKYPDCRILLFSGQASTADLLDSARDQGYDFEILAKPVHPGDLLARAHASSQTFKTVDGASHIRKAS